MWRKWLGTAKQDSVNLSLVEQVKQKPMPQHIAIIMDGNGRWAKKRGMMRSYGHRAGADRLRSIVRTAAELGVSVLTTYAFSTENWKRPAQEVDFLMKLFWEYLDNNIEEMHQNQVTVRFIGKTEELSPALYEKMMAAEAKTANNTGLVLNLAVNYGGRAEIVSAVQKIAQEVKEGTLQVEDITEKMLSDRMYTGGLPDPDLLIRPSGDLRISNFLLWQLAYAEFWFTGINWPDFTSEVLLEAILEYQKRDRRFGGLKNK